MFYSKYAYKDSPPKDTIKKIKDILLENGISLTESWLPEACGLYVVNLLFDSGKVSSGKGISKEYALASAYSEFMERLQNLFVGGFSFSVPDEKNISIQDFLNQKSIYTLKTLSYYLNPEEKNPNSEKSIEKLNKILTILKKKEVKTVPFYSLKEDKEVFLPVDIIRPFHLTTGMCAGNTPEEALVQGLCEIIERYAGYEIIRSQILPPLIPEVDYINFEKIKLNIDFYRSQGYEIEFRDCSLKKDLPVVLMVVYNKNKHSYTTTFSSHPCFEIALQRCFTEFRQEKDELVFNDKEKFYPFELKHKDYDIEFELRRNLLESIIHLNFDSVSNNNELEYNPNVWNYEFSSNKEMLNYLVKIVLKISDNIYIRDVSFLGFNTYSILVPELSFNLIDEKVFSVMLNKQVLRNALYDLNSEEVFNDLTKDEIYDCFDWHIKTDYSTQKINMLLGIDDLEFLAAFSYVNGDFSRTIKYLNMFIENDNKNSKRFTKNIAFALKLYISYKQRKLSDDEIYTILYKIFDNEIVSYIKKCWIQSNPFYNCLYIHTKILEKSILNRKSRKLITKKLEKKYAENLPSQLNLRNIQYEIN